MSAKRQPPRLPASAFVKAPLVAKRTQPVSLIDTHIHLITPTQIDSGVSSWPSAASSPQNVLSQPHELPFYGQVLEAAVSSAHIAPVEGFVFVQAEVIHNDAEDGQGRGWDASINEVDSVCQAALACPSPPLLGIVPWVLYMPFVPPYIVSRALNPKQRQAPIHKGPAALQLYISRLEALPSLLALSHQASSLSGSTAGKTPSRLIKGFRYLLQDSPPGFFTKPDFIASLKWLGENDYEFDMTLDAGPDQQGPAVLEEAIECISKVHEGQSEGKETKFILDHFAKPDLVSEPTFPLKDTHSSYIRSMFSLSLLPNVYVKLSGLLDSASQRVVAEAFAEYRQGVALKINDLHSGHNLSSPVAVSGESASQPSPSSSSLGVLKRRILTFLEPVLESFGDSKIVYGSDFPMFRAKTITSTSVATRDHTEEAAAYAFQVELYRLCLVDLGLEGESLDRVFSGNSRVFYGV
ncbi:hypothetical protein P7C70_g1053, partial [Phenoliferia sp. Uapishka_3]